MYAIFTMLTAVMAVFLYLSVSSMVAAAHVFESFPPCWQPCVRDLSAMCGQLENQPRMYTLFPHVEETKRDRVGLLNARNVASAHPVSLSATPDALLSCAQRSCPSNDLLTVTKTDLEMMLRTACREEQVGTEAENLGVSQKVEEVDDSETRDVWDKKDGKQSGEAGVLELRSTPPETTTITESVIIQTASTGSAGPPTATATGKASGGGNGGTVLDQGGSGAGRVYGMEILWVVSMSLLGIGLNVVLW